MSELIKLLYLAIMHKVGILENDINLARLFSQFIESLPNFTCVFYALSIQELMEHISLPEKPDLLLMDIELDRQENSLPFLHEIKWMSGSKIIVITGHNHEVYVEQAIRNGADGIYIKGSGLPKLVEALTAALNGDLFISPEAGPLVANVIRRTRSSDISLKNAPDIELQMTINALSKRELEILKLLVRGIRYDDAAKTLGISINTVRHYVKILYQKFDVDNKAALSNKTSELLGLSDK